ncbi:hypothetical protein CSUI_005011 [Cystoisospora suis]|uniref:Uncharacterized protein n=1 Tax=Cystoisospora suis TaxID=483139 RepID=A0A2C6KV90_9APIC|nr:hypothetical protein CSUI_005011 [Cystoisospora suis]
MSTSPCFFIFSLLLLLLLLKRFPEILNWPYDVVREFISTQVATEKEKKKQDFLVRHVWYLRDSQEDKEKEILLLLAEEGKKEREEGVQVSSFLQKKILSMRPYLHLPLRPLERSGSSLA